MRILHLTPELPYAAGGGGRSAQYLHCRRLVELGHDVLNVSPVLPHEHEHARDLRAAGAESWLVTRPASKVVEVLRAVAADVQLLVAGVTLPVRGLEMRVFWTRLQALAERAVAEWRPDVVLLAHDMAASWIRSLPPSLPVVLMLQNLTWRWYESRARLAGPGPRALALRAEAWRYRRHVMRALPRFSSVVAVSTAEAEEARVLGANRVALIPAGVDTQTLRPAREAPSAPPLLLFTGTMSYAPNHQGISWFADQVWPRVGERVPEARLAIVGKDPPARVLALARRPGIEVAGFVPEMAPWFARATLVVVPILTGAGIRVKIVEAMAAGRAVVSTSLGWEGLAHVEPGRHLLVADDPVAFADAAVDLLRDPQRRRSLAAAARELAEREYDWRPLGSRLARVLEDAAHLR